MLGLKPVTCPRHRGLCAFTGQEPARCPYCHTTWDAVRGCICPQCQQSQKHHIDWHEAYYAQVDKDRLKRELRTQETARAADTGSIPGPGI